MQGRCELSQTVWLTRWGGCAHVCGGGPSRSRMRCEGLYEATLSELTQIPPTSDVTFTRDKTPRVPYQPNNRIPADVGCRNIIR